MEWNELVDLYNLLLDNVFPELDRDIISGIELSETLEFWSAKYHRKGKTFSIEISKSSLKEMDKYDAILTLTHELSHILAGIGPKNHKILSGYITTLIDEAVACLITLAKIPKILSLLKEDEKRKFIVRAVREFDLHNPAYIISDIENTREVLVGYGFKEDVGKEIKEILDHSPLSIMVYLYYLLDRYGDRKTEEVLAKGMSAQQ